MSICLAHLGLEFRDKVPSIYNQGLDVAKWMACKILSAIVLILNGRFHTTRRIRGKF